MKKSIIMFAAILAVCGGIVFYLYYDTVLTYTDDYTDCPIKAFKAAVTDPSKGAGFATQQSYGSLENTEKCNMDCGHGNQTACAVYALAVQYGVFVPQSEQEAKDRYSQACEEGAKIACDLSAYIEKLKDDAKKALELEAEKAARAALLERVKLAKVEAENLKQEALDYYKGGTGPMTSAAMVKYNQGNFHYLLYEMPMLSGRHAFKGSEKMPPDMGLREFLEAKYVNGSWGVKAEELLALLEEFQTTGMAQLKLDHFVEDKEESDIPKNNKYFKAKYTFLYHLAEAEIPVLEETAKKMASEQ